MDIDQLLVDADRVLASFTQSGTQTGELMGIADDKIVESWYDVDMVGMMQQLGVGG